MTHSFYPQKQALVERGWPGRSDLLEAHALSHVFYSSQLWGWADLLLQQQGNNSMQDTYQPLVPGKDDCVEHWLIEQTVTHPLADDDVYLLHGQLHLLHFTLKYGDDWKRRTPRPYFAGTLARNQVSATLQLRHVLNLFFLRRDTLSFCSVVLGSHIRWQSKIISGSVLRAEIPVEAQGVQKGLQTRVSCMLGKHCEPCLISPTCDTSYCITLVHTKRIGRLVYTMRKASLIVSTPLKWTALGNRYDY